MVLKQHTHPQRYSSGYIWHVWPISMPRTAYMFVNTQKWDKGRHHEKEKNTCFCAFLERGFPFKGKTLTFPLKNIYFVKGVYFSLPSFMISKASDM